MVLSTPAFFLHRWPVLSRRAKALHFLLDFEFGRSRCDNQRTIWLCCEAYTKPTAITLTFTLHYCVFIHSALSRSGPSGMTDGVLLGDGWMGRINRILQPFHFEQCDTAERKTHLFMFALVWHMLRDLFVLCACFTCRSLSSCFARWVKGSSSGHVPLLLLSGLPSIDFTRWCHLRPQGSRAV